MNSELHAVPDGNLQLVFLVSVDHAVGEDLVCCEVQVQIATTSTHCQQSSGNDSIVNHDTT